MFRLALGFLVLAMFAAFFGFGGQAGYSWEAAKILFYVFLGLAVLAFLGRSFRRRSSWQG